MNFQTRTTETRDDWQTPKEMVEALGAFDLDPCANCQEPTRLASKGFTISDDGLKREWIGRVWLNPPYGSAVKLWLERLSNHGNGVALIPPRMGAIWFHETVLTGFDAIFFLKGRTAFINASTGKKVQGNNADSILVAYGKENVSAIEKSGLSGVLWKRSV